MRTGGPVGKSGSRALEPTHRDHGVEATRPTQCAVPGGTEPPAIKNLAARSVKYDRTDTGAGLAEKGAEGGQHRKGSMKGLKEERLDVRKDDCAVEAPWVLETRWTTGEPGKYRWTIKESSKVVVGTANREVVVEAYVGHPWKCPPHTSFSFAQIAPVLIRATWLPGHDVDVVPRWRWGRPGLPRRTWFMWYRPHRYIVPSANARAEWGLLREGLGVDGRAEGGGCIVERRDREEVPRWRARWSAQSGTVVVRRFGVAHPAAGSMGQASG
ncbi:hypothetical protein B0H19DRAFT_1237326 [Mycena capillaripes]|nr:hypothetical protein B0H19DRAFT_1237326 [Mycena capillaripes]